MVGNVKLRISSDRGFANHGWLKTYHSFSFTGYYDPSHMHFSVLRVLNDDVIEAGQGFGMHPHKNMEIITYLLRGELQHEDSLGSRTVLKAGDVQCTTAGSGVVHSEYNASETDPVHFLQIWIFPERKLFEPSYSVASFSTADKQDHWCLIVSRDGRDNSLIIQQDASIFATLMSPGGTLNYDVPEHRSVYIQMASGELEVLGTILKTGDALMLDGPDLLEFKSILPSEVLLFDLPIHHSVDFMQQ